MFSCSKSNFRRSFLVVLWVLSASVPASAQEDKSFSLGVGIGVEYDDNVTVDQNDLSAGVGDQAAVLDASASYRFFDNASGSFDVGYEFSQSLHRELTGFDIQSHALSANGEVKFGGMALGGGYTYYRLLLGGRSFLDMHMLNPGISGFVTDRLFVRGSYFYFGKNFATANTRDATTHQPGVDAFYFFAQSKAYFALGGRYEKEDTTGPEFDYGGYIFRANLQLPVTIASKVGKVNFGYQYLTRDYDNITPSIGAMRQENRNTFSVTGEIPVMDRLRLVADYRYIDRSSNLPAVNYKENVFTTSLKYDF
jgi:hypothetical protein